MYVFLILKITSSKYNLMRYVKKITLYLMSFFYINVGVDHFINPQYFMSIMRVKSQIVYHLCLQNSGYHYCYNNSFVNNNVFFAT